MHRPVLCVVQFHVMYPILTDPAAVIRLTKPCIFHDTILGKGNTPVGNTIFQSSVAFAVTMLTLTDTEQYKLWVVLYILYQSVFSHLKIMKTF